jgi:hypothetical protein
MSKNLIIILAILMISISACKDKCENTVCENGGVCADGTCVCPPGYSGETCSIADPCLNTNCMNGGECIDGTCECPAGYEGINCEQTVATKFLGTYDVICNGTLDINGNTQDFIDEPATAKLYQGEKTDEIIMYVELDMVSNSIPMVVEAEAEVDGLEYELKPSPEVIDVNIAGINLSLSFFVTATGVLSEDHLQLDSEVNFTGDLEGVINCTGIKQQ